MLDNMERKLLTWMIHNPGSFKLIGAKTYDFTDLTHSELFEVLSKIDGAGMSDDAEALAFHLDMGEFDGHVIEVAHELIEAEPEAGSLKEAMKALKSLRVYKANQDVRVYLEEAHEALNTPRADILEVATLTARRIVKSASIAEPERTAAEILGPILTSELDAIDKSLNPLISSGVSELDHQFGGVAREGCTLVIGESRMGKTTLMNRLLIGLASEGHKVALHGTETSEEERVRDIIFTMARANQVDSRYAKDDHKEIIKRNLVNASNLISDWSPQITGSGLSIEALCAKWRRWHRDGKITVAMVDYVQDFPTRKSGSTTVEFIMSCSQQLKDLSAELRLPIIVGAQAKRKSLDEANKSPYPGMWDVQWASKLSQDAEEVWCIFRSDVYVQEWGNNWRGDRTPGLMQVFRRKSRKSGADRLDISFDGPTKWIGEAWGGFAPIAVYEGYAG